MVVVVVVLLLLFRWVVSLPLCLASFTMGLARMVVWLARARIAPPPAPRALVVVVVGIVCCL